MTTRRLGPVPPVGGYCMNPVDSLSTSIKLSRHLIVGFGVAGLSTLLLLRRRILQNYGTVTLPWVQFLQFTIGRDSFTASRAEGQLQLPPSALVNAELPREHVANFKRDSGRYSHMAEWVSPELSKYGLGESHFLTRNVGRLAFFCHYQSFSQKLSDALASLTSGKIRKVEFGQRRVEVGPNVVVSIVGSLASQSSGMFLDAAFLVRNQLQRINVLPADLTGIFYLPPPSDVDNPAVANAYASLRELTHYLDPTTEFSARYEEFAAPLRDRLPPFTRCYLLGTGEGGAEEGAHVLPKEVAAERLFLEVSSECGSAVRKLHRDLQLQNQGQRRPFESFCSFGVSSLSVPKSWLENLYAARLAQAVLERWGAKVINNPSVEVMLGKVARRLAELEESLTRLPPAERADASSANEGMRELYEQRVGNKVVEAVSRDVLNLTGQSASLDLLRRIGEDRLFGSLLSSARAYVQDIPAPNVVEALFDPPAQAASPNQTFSALLRASLPGLRFQPLSTQEEGSEVLLLGVPNLLKNQGRFRQLLMGEGMKPPHDCRWVNLSDQHRMALITERLWFSPQQLKGFELYADAYRRALSSIGAAVHARCDVEWRPLGRATNDPERRLGLEEIPSIAELTVRGNLLRIVSDDVRKLPVEAVVFPLDYGKGGRESGRGVYLSVTPLNASSTRQEVRLEADDGETDTESFIRRAVASVFEECARQRWASVGLPVLSLPGAGLSENECLEIMFEEVRLRLEQVRYPQLVLLSVTSSEGLFKVGKLMASFEPGADKGGGGRERSGQARSSQGFAYTVENLFPRSIARSFSQLRGLPDWRGQVQVLQDVLSLLLQHLCYVIIADYVSSPLRDSEVDEYLLHAFRQPNSIGHWRTVLKKLMTFLHSRNHQFFIEELPKVYFKSDELPRSETLLEKLEKLITARNIQAHGLKEVVITREQHDEVKRGLVNVLRLVDFLSEYPLVSVEQSTVEKGVKTHSCYSYMGSLDVLDRVDVQCDLDIEKGQVVILNLARNQLLYLNPFYRVGKCDDAACAQQHFFRFEQLEAKGIKYGAAGVATVLDPQAGREFRNLFTASTGEGLRKKAAYLYLDVARMWDGVWSDYSAGYTLATRAGKRYEIVELLRRGGMSDVYKVRDHDEFYALKLLPAQFLRSQTIVRRFRMEAERVRQLKKHPQITTIMDYGRDGDDHFLVMELATGWKAGERVALDVHELIQGPLDEALAVKIIRQVCEGLCFLHEEGVIHRDIKPANLLLFDHDRVKVADFGIALWRETLKKLTVTGLPMGTPEYMSPEQATGGRNLTVATDVYSLGVVMYEMLTGRVPFKKDSAVATGIAHKSQKVPPLMKYNPLISDGMHKIIMRCLKKQPQLRYVSVKELLKEMATL